MEVGKKIKIYLKLNGIKLNWVSEKLDIPRTTLYSALSSNKKMPVDLYARICNLFNLSLDYFLQED